MLAHMHGRAAVSTIRQPQPPAALHALIDDFADLVVNQPFDVCVTYIDILRDRGHALRDIMLSLLAPTARRLGTRWENDTADFIEVTVGTSRLQQLLWHFSPRLENPVVAQEKRILLLPAPGEEHTFGLVVLSELFKANGWAVTLGSALSTTERTKLLKKNDWDIIGYSLGNNRLIDDLRSAIRLSREKLRDRATRIIVGGFAISASGLTADDLGADFAVVDPLKAIEYCEDAMSSS